MDRTDFFNKVMNNGSMEYDHLYNNLSKFKMEYPVGYYRVVQEDIMRPDLISYKQYGSVSYWWIVCYVNGIQDPLNEIQLGTLFVIPNVVDIYNFYKKYRLT